MIYLNNAATSYPKPPTVTEAVLACLRALPVEPGRTHADGEGDPIAIARRQAADLLGVTDPARVVFTSGSTEALNLAIRGLELRGAHVVTTATEHNSVLRPLTTLEREGTIRLTVVPCDAEGRVAPAAVAGALTAATRLVVMNHASNVTGAVQDAAALAACAHARGALLLLDASQSAGCLPLAAEAWDVDLLAFTGHKALYGPAGTGGLYVRAGVDLAPLKTGGTGSRSDLLTQPPELPTRLEAGTSNLPGLAGLGAALAFVRTRGTAALHAMACARLDQMLEGLRRMPRVRVYAAAAEPRAPVAAFNVAGLSPGDVGYMLERSFGIVVREGLHCAPLIHAALGTAPLGCVRISPSCFTTEADAAALVAAVSAIAEAA